MVGEIDEQSAGSNIDKSNQPLQSAGTHSPIVNLHCDKRNELVALNLGELTSHHIGHFVEVTHLQECKHRG